MVDELRLEPAGVADELTTFIRQAVEDFRREGAIIGLSWGDCFVTPLRSVPRNDRGRVSSYRFCY